MKISVLFLSLLIAGIAVAPAQAGIMDMLKKYSNPAATLTASGLCGAMVLVGLPRICQECSSFKNHINAGLWNKMPYESFLKTFVMVGGISQALIITAVAINTFKDGIEDIKNINAENNQ